MLSSFAITRQTVDPIKGCGNPQPPCMDNSERVFEHDGACGISIVTSQGGQAIIKDCEAIGGSSADAAFGCSGLGDFLLQGNKATGPGIGVRIDEGTKVKMKKNKFTGHHSAISIAPKKVWKSKSQ